MFNVIDALNSKEDLLYGTGVSEEEVIRIEKLMGLSFAEDYKCYLKQYGVVAFDGHELTGITKVKRVNVASVTAEEKEKNNCVPNDMYVIEQTHYDGIVVWQDSEGTIYQTTRDSEPIEIYKSLYDYLSD